MAYTKLDTNIIYSTVWKERAEVVKVWFTLMALADRDGYVGASIEGIARAALVTEDIVEAALRLFQSPDPKSRTKDFEGRRIMEVDGGWKLLNHAKYRDAQSAEERREAAARRQREYMERKRAKEAKEREALEAARGVSGGDRSLLTRNDTNDRNDPSDQAQDQAHPQAQDPARDKVAPTSRSGSQSSLQRPKTGKSAAATAAPATAEEVSPLREVYNEWYTRGRPTHPTSGKAYREDYDEFEKAFRRKGPPTVAEFAAKVQLRLARYEVDDRPDRSAWLGQLITFLESGKWRDELGPPLPALPPLEKPAAPTYEPPKPEVYADLGEKW